MKISVMNSFDGDEFGFQYLSLNTLRDVTNTLHQRLEYYCDTQASWLDPNAVPNNIISRVMLRGGQIPHYMLLSLANTIGGNNVLVIPNWNDRKHNNLYDRDYTTIPYLNERTDIFCPTHSLVQHFSPVWQKLLDCPLNLYVAMPPGDSLFHFLYGEYGVKMVSASKQYALGENVFSGYTIDVPSDVKFDAVVLLNHDRPAEGLTYKASDIKKDFAQYCKPNFVLQDLYSPPGPMNVLLEQGLMTYRGITSDIPENPEGIRNFEKVVQSSLLSRGGDGVVSSSTLNKGRMIGDSDLADPEGNHTSERFKGGAVNPIIWDTVDSNGEKVNVRELFRKVGLEETFRIQHKNLSDMAEKNNWSDIIKIW